MPTSISGFSNTPTVSNSYTISSFQNCINVKNGLYLINSNIANGDFAINCNLPAEFNTLGIKLFPNPVFGFSKVKFINTPPLIELFKISIFNYNGVLENSFNDYGYNIYQGIMLDFSILSAGTYIIQISSSNYIDALKFVKLN